MAQENERPVALFGHMEMNAIVPIVRCAMLPVVCA
jgi:hypothetical protein